MPTLATLLHERDRESEQSPACDNCSLRCYR
jgi:hypothetical protein